MSVSASAATYVKPIDNGVITTGFNGYPGHGGVDYAIPQGTPIRAVADGTVKFAGAGAQHSWMTWLAGNSILIQHGDGLHSGYAHLSSIATHTGASVKQGDIIGYVGATGMATGPHLHFEFLPANPNFKNGYSGRIDPTGMIANAPTFTGQSATQSASVSYAPQASSAASSTGAQQLKIYRVDDLQKVNGSWFVRNNELVPTGFEWKDNGIPVEFVDTVDANGNMTASQVLHKGSYFVFNPKQVTSVGAPLQGTAGYRWSKTTYSNGRTSWFVVNNQNQLLYGR
ncbi:lytic exoenzyme target recognition domain-containing protein [Streptococcus saliviloxodontae]